MPTFELVIREPGQPERRVALRETVDAGREVEGLLLADEQVSRRHVRFTVKDGSVSVTDLGSTNGTTVNGNRIEGPVALSDGDTIEVGNTIMRFETRADVAPPEREPRTPLANPPVATSVHPPEASKSADVTAPAAPPPPPASPAPAAPAPAPTPPPAPEPVVKPVATSAPRPVLDELASRANDAVVVRYRPGTAGERAAAGVAKQGKAARARLAGLGSEPWGTVPTVCLVDPFPDPDQPGAVMTEGTIVDAARNEIWMVVTPESPPEPLERPLALCFGGALPAAAELGPLLEGYGLYVADGADPDAELRQIVLPPLGAAGGEAGAAMALSFVRFLMTKASKAEFLQFVSSAQPGKLEAAAQTVYGTGLVALEESWRTKLMGGAPKVKTGQFLRLAVRYLRPHKRREAEMFVYLLFGLAFTVVFPFAFKYLLDTAIPSLQFSKVLDVLAVLLIAFIISLLAGLRGAYLSAYVSSSVVRQLRREMFTKMQTLPQAWYSQRQQGDVLSRLFNDVGMLEQGLSQTLQGGLSQILSLVVSAIVLVILNPLLAVITLAGAPVIGFVYKSMANGAQKRSIAVQEETGSVLSVASENYSAQPVVKAFGLQQRENSRFAQASDRLFDRQVSLTLFGGIFGLSVNMIVTLLRVLILALGSWLIIHGHLSVGGLVAFMSLMGEVLSPVTVLTGIGQQVQASTGALVRINEVLDASPEVDEPADLPELGPVTRDIVLRDVGFSYTTERRTLEDVNVTIAAGQKVAFVGPTGAGKSSVMQLLMRFYDPDEGAVLFDGHDSREVTIASLRDQLGVVFQETFLFNATIRDNVAMAKPGATDAEIEAAAQAAEMHDFVSTLPRGYDTLVGERGGRLSGGQKQRLSIARALLRDPSVLLLDEATSALDPRTERLIADTLDRVGQGRTTIAVTHRLTSITHYDKICVIVSGHLVEQGTHEELVRQGGTYAQLWAEQTGGAIPTEAPFDAVGALSRIPILASLGPDELASVAGRLRAIDLQAGETVAEGGGRLLILRRGRAVLLGRDYADNVVQTAELGIGDAFGLAALLGSGTEATLQATEPSTMLVLDDEVIRALAASHRDIADALEGTTARVVGPAGGTRLSRMTMGVTRAMPAADLVGAAVGAPSADDVRRLTGSMKAVGQ